MIQPEIEVNVLIRQCLDRRIPEIEVMMDS